MVVVAIVIGVLLAVLFIFGMARRKDAQQAVGVLSQESRRRDRTDDAIHALDVEAPTVSGREVEHMAIERARGNATVLTSSRAPEVAAPPRPVDLEALGVTRRQFLNRAILGMVGVSVAGFGASVLAFLWPTLEAGGFGAVINVGAISDINATIATKQPYYSSPARAYVNPFPLVDLTAAIKSGAYDDPIINGMKLGYVALYQKCPHLGCRVPWCQSSQWFECPCHGSQYNRVGEKKGGPAPRGMDHFALAVNTDGTMSVDTSTVYIGPPIGTNTTGQGAEGPHCV